MHLPWPRHPIRARLEGGPVSGSIPSQTAPERRLT